LSQSAEAQAYPTRPITMVVPFAAGSSSDVTARVLAEQMRSSLRQPIIIENANGGADGSIGTGRVARSKPDGYTIELATASTHMMNGAVYSLGYHVVNDFAPISPLVTVPGILFARKTMPAKDLNELIAWLKDNPNKASAGITSSYYRLITAFFQKETATQFTFVPYRTNPTQDLVAGQIDFSFLGPDRLPLARAESIKAYAVTSNVRLAIAPHIATFAEIGLPSLSFSNWYALFAPNRTPKEIIDRLHAATVQALADPLVQSRLADLGFEIFPSERQTPEALSAMQKAQIDKWWPIIKEFAIRAE
jgi:tripartite-type tricarboxylate transporter receptor subunit TctC